MLQAVKNHSRDTVPIHAAYDLSWTDNIKGDVGLTYMQ